MRKLLPFKPYLLMGALLLGIGFSSCSKSSAKEPSGGGTNEANVVTGIAVDAQGRPLAGVKVRAENPTGNNIHIDGTTGADGRYKLKLTSIGGWKIYAWKEVTYQDQVYHLRLGMKTDQDYDAFATEGKTLVRDFVWKLSGRIPDRSASFENGWGYFGASLRLVNYNDVVPEMPAGAKLTVTLTPVNGAKYLDGSAATTPVVKAITIQNGKPNYYMGDVPVTTYRITAQCEVNGVTKKVFIGASSASNLTEWIEFYFDPSGSSSGSYESGLQSPNDFPFYLGRQS